VSSQKGEGRPRYPGERVLETRRENMEKGVPVEPSIWREVQDLAAERT
jgi:3-dehydro-L-gulonate 2-dehydrogenase